MTTPVNLYRDSLSELFRTGAGTVGTTAEQLDLSDPADLLSGVRIKADLDNTEAIYVGYHSGVGPTNGYKLEAGQEVGISVNLLSKVWLEGGAAGQDYSWIAQ